MNTRQSLMMVAALLTAVGLAACASQPQRNEQLEQARLAVQSLEQDPDAQVAAAADLRDARNNLQYANQAFEKNESPEHVTYLAYLADREAQAGARNMPSAYRANRELAKGNEERNRHPAPGPQSGGAAGAAGRG